MFVAGSETVSITIAFILYELALNKDVQDKLREEIITVTEKHGGQLNNDFVTDLRYTNMVLEGNEYYYNMYYPLAELLFALNILDQSIVFNILLENYIP